MQTAGKDDVVFLYATAPDRDVAGRIAQALVRERHAACVNIIPGMTSVYRWNDEVETADEFVLIVKTTGAGAQSAKDLIRQLHPYETPAVIAFAALENGTDAAYAAWLGACVGDRKS